MTPVATLREKVWVSLVILTTGTITLWSAILYGIRITEPDSAIVGVLGLNGLAIVLFELTLTVGLFVGPIGMRRRWMLGERLATGIIGGGWITACVLSTALIVAVNPLVLPGWPTGVPADVGQTISWIAILLLIVIMSLVPAALLPVSQSRIPGAACQVPTPAGSSLEAAGSAERLWRVLDALFHRAPGPADAKTTLLHDGTIVTSQGALADRLDTSKGSIHRGLAELEYLGRIRVETNPRETLIRRAPPGGTVVSLLPGGPLRHPGTVETAVNGAERDDPNRP